MSKHLVPRICFPVLASEFPVLLCRELDQKPRLHRPYSGLPEPQVAKFCEIPCIFPCYQGIQRGDRFAVDGLVSQPMIYPLQGKLDLAYLSAQSFPKREETL
jgi:hypothetical protein